MTAGAVLDAPVASQFHEVPLEELHESPLNPRRHFDPAALAELAESIRTHGVITPALARPRVQGGYELAAGHRRFRAAKLAKLETLSVIVREMTDVELLEILTIENLQREDVSALEEAEGFRSLIDKAGYDVARIALRVKKSKEYVYASLKLLELAEAPRKALEAGTLTPSHAILIARLEPEVQKTVTQQVVASEKGGDTVSVRQLNHTIELEVRAKQREDAITATLAKAEQDHPGQKVHRLIEGYGSETGALGHGEWKEVKKGTEKALVGVIIPGRWDHAKKPRLAYFTKPAKGESHTSRPAMSDKEVRAREKARRATEERKEKLEQAAARAITSKVTHPLPTPVLARVLADALPVLWGAAEKAIWEVVGLKAPTGYRSPGADEKALLKCSAEQLSRGLVFCLLNQDGGADDRETALAKLYGVDVKKARAEAEAALTPVQTPATPKKRAGEVARTKKKAKKG